MAREVIEGRREVLPTGTVVQKHPEDSKSYVFAGNINERARAESVDFDAIRTYVREFGLDLSDEVTQPLGLSDLQWHLLLPQKDGTAVDLIFVGTSKEAIVNTPGELRDNAVGTIVISRSTNWENRITIFDLMLAGIKDGHVVEAQYDFSTGGCVGVSVSIADTDNKKVLNRAHGHDQYAIRDVSVYSFMLDNVREIPRGEDEFSWSNGLTLAAMARQVGHRQLIKTYNSVAQRVIRPNFSYEDAAESLGLSVGEDADRAQIVSNGTVLSKLSLSLPLYIGTQPQIAQQV